MIPSKLIILSAILIVVQSCQRSVAEMPLNNKKEAQNLTFLALGDSYTIGERVEVSERWPVQLADSMRNRGFNFNQPEIIARTGWTTDELARAIRNTPPDSTRYDLVSLLIGVNNQYRGRSLEQYRVDFVDLLAKAIDYTAGNQDRVIVLSIPDYSVTPFASTSNRQKIASEIDMFNAVNKTESLKAGVHYFDITPISRKAGQDASLIAEDGLHPSGKMYGEWVSLILPEVEKLLEE